MQTTKKNKPSKTITNTKATNTKAINVAIIGAGGIALTHHKAYVAAGANVQAIVEPTESTRQLRMREWGVRGYKTIEEMLKKEKNLEAVSVCTPNAFHFSATIKAINAGLGVLCEKPLSMSLTQCKQMIAAAKKAGVVLQTGHHLRSNLLVKKAKAIMDADTIGRVTFMRLRQAHDWGGNETLRESFGLYKNSGGGTLLDNGCHMMDLARLLGGSVKNIFARTATLGAWTNLVEVEDTSLVSLQFRTGTLVSIENAWTATGWEEGFWIYGTKGAIECTNRLGPRSLRLLTRDSGSTDWAKQDETIFKVADEGGHAGAIISFIRSVREHAPVVCTGEDGMESVRLVLSAYESAKLGRPVEL